MSELVTPSQTAGPYFAMRLPWPQGPFVVPLVTLKPGMLPFGDGRVEAPHIDVSVFARGMLDRCVTRIYFPDEAALNGADPVLAAVPAGRRPTLVAVPLADGLLEFDIHVQGDRETVFFDL